MDLLLVIPLFQTKINEKRTFLDWYITLKDNECIKLHPILHSVSEKHYNSTVLLAYHEILHIMVQQFSLRYVSKQKIPVESAILVE